MAESLDVKIARLRRVAEQVVARYDARGCRLRFLGHRENITFRLEVAEGELQRYSPLRTQPAAFVLRLHHSIHPLRSDVWQRPDVIRGEMQWLESLHQHGELVVPRPVRNREGMEVTSVTDEHGKTYHASLLTWVEGQHLQADPTPEQARSLGRMLATMHRHALGWELPEGFYRPTYSPDNLLSSVDALERLIELRIVRRTELDTIQTVVRRIREHIESLGSASRVGGLIHADLHETNYVFERDQPRPIDFSCCGFGYLLFDIGYALRHIAPFLRGHFLTGYHAVRELTGVQPTDLEAFLIWGTIDNFAFHAPLRDEQEYLTRAVPYLCQNHCRMYLSGRPFLQLV